MKKTVAYYRSSTDLQEHSIEMQRSKAMYTSLEKRIIIDEEFVDEKSLLVNIIGKTSRITTTYCTNQARDY